MKTNRSMVFRLQASLLSAVLFLPTAALASGGSSTGRSAPAVTRRHAGAPSGDPEQVSLSEAINLASRVLGTLGTGTHASGSPTHGAASPASSAAAGTGGCATMSDPFCVSGPGAQDQSSYCYYTDWQGERRRYSIGGGFWGSNHTYVISNETTGCEARVVDDPVSSNGSWSPTPLAFRAPGYHDPWMPGARLYGSSEVWVQDVGFVADPSFDGVWTSYNSDGSVKVQGNMVARKIPGDAFGRSLWVKDAALKCVPSSYDSAGRLKTAGHCQ